VTPRAATTIDLEKGTDMAAETRSTASPSATGDTGQPELAEIRRNTPVAI
jgi:hypothetical protein